MYVVTKKTLSFKSLNMSKKIFLEGLYHILLADLQIMITSVEYVTTWRCKHNIQKYHATYIFN